MAFEVYYAEAGQDDFTAPSIWQVEGLAFQGLATFRVLVQDEAGVERVVVTYSEDGEQWRSVELDYDATTGLWETSLAGVGGWVSYLVQAVDGAGNVAITANKGLLFEAQERAVYLPFVLKSP